MIVLVVEGGEGGRGRGTGEKERDRLFGELLWMIFSTLEQHCPRTLGQCWLLLLEIHQEQEVMSRRKEMFRKKGRAVVTLLRNNQTWPGIDSSLCFNVAVKEHLGVLSL